MKKLLQCCVLLFLFLAGNNLYAQVRTISGTVTAKEDNLPLPGVSVTLKGTSVGTTTDGFGKYSIKISKSNDVLIFSSLGYAEQSVTVRGIRLWILNWNQILKL